MPTATEFRQTSLSGVARAESVEPFEAFGLRWHRAMFTQVESPNSERKVLLFFRGDLLPDSFSRSVRLASEKDAAQAVISGYLESGLAFLKHLNGWFSGCLIDFDEATATVFNDRFGLGRVYYAEIGNELHFAVDPTVLCKLLGKTTDFELDCLGEWLSCGSVLQNRSLFEGVSVLPPASLWRFAVGERPRRSTYFETSDWSGLPKLSASEYKSALVESFPHIVRAHLTTSDQIAMSLTGGLDGRMVMACSGARPGQLPCYTFAGPYRECADLRIARQVASACDQSHQPIQIDDDFFRTFPKLAAEVIAFGGAAMDVSGAAELYVNRRASEIARFRLTGNYGSEVLRGTVAFRPKKRISPLFVQDVQSACARAAETYSRERATDDLSFIISKQVPWHHYARFAIEHVAIRVRSPFLDNTLVRLAFTAPEGSLSDPAACWEVVSRHAPQLARIPTDRGVVWPCTPFVTSVRRRWSESIAKMEYLFDYGMPNWLARADRLNIGSMFLGRQKFCHFRTWYRNELSGFVQDTLLGTSLKIGSLLDRKTLRASVQNHISGKENHTLLINQLISLELAKRQILN